MEYLFIAVDNVVPNFLNVNQPEYMVVCRET
jgi:hypothetical protein